MRTPTRFLLTICFALSLTAIASAQPPATFNQLAKLTAPDGATNDEFGYSVAASGNVIVVGKYEASVQSAFVYENNSGTVTQVAELTPSDGVAGDRFGISVAISGSTIIVGSDHLNHDPQNGGSIYVYVEPAGGWTDATETAELNFKQKGAGIAQSIGTNGSSVVSTNTYDGSIVIWNKPSGGWVSSSMPNAQLLTGSAGDFLTNVAISGNVIVAGCPRAFSFYGTTFLYVKPASGWNKIGISPTARLIGSGPASGGGLGVAISGNTVVSSTGASVYVFVKPSAGWANMNQTATLTDANAYPALVSVGVSGGTVVVGDGGQLVGVNPGQGAVFVYQEPSGGWKNLTTPNAELVADDGNIGDNLGDAVGVSGGTVVAGAPLAALGSNTQEGAAYVFGED